MKKGERVKKEAFIFCVSLFLSFCAVGSIPFSKSREKSERDLIEKRTGNKKEEIVAEKP